MPCPSHPPWLHHSKYTWRRVQVMKLLIIVRRQMWIQHAGAPAHFSIVSRDYLDAAFHGCWIGRGGPEPWPPRTPDLTPLDYFVWGHV
ncbi:hypothetical protein B7P43_G01232 [Cryptotermes secundus]|uniref:Uncharacterized protein n=1 Tax=Cryptotermes secundus TaxID=105785 RepID=A0A2J7QNU6_9NEOP|nr:hypothetical protein B7P43_G01232 [Cryptotermes secundus]